MNLGTHAGFIVAAYVVTLAVVAALIAWVALDHRVQKRNLARMEARGVTRRSERASTGQTA
jgi:heme exporter protein D